MEIAVNSISRMEVGENSQVREAVSRKQVTQEDTARQEKEAGSVISSQGDILTISEEGRAASEEAENQVVRLSGSETGTAVQQVKEEYSAGADSSNSTIDLSSYTETELKQMYLDGDITKAEYDEEISSRETQA